MFPLPVGTMTIASAGTETAIATARTTDMNTKEQGEIDFMETDDLRLRWCRPETRMATALREKHCLIVVAAAQ